MSPRRTRLRRFASRVATLGELLRYFVHRERFFLLPVLIVLLCAAILLLLTSGLSYVAPFVYTLF